MARKKSSLGAGDTSSRTTADSVAVPGGARPAPIVSSAHLAAGASPSLSELEFSLNLLATAYQRWIVRCMATTGAQMSALEVLILHTVRHRDRSKRLGDIMLVLDLDEAHLATYAIRKLESAGLVKANRVGKEKLVSITPAGVLLCDKYGAMRENLLVRTVRALGMPESVLSETAARLRVLSGTYEQAARSAATM
jgi:predicted MarR family transcription regulator